MMPSKNFRVIVNGVSFFTSDALIEEGVGDHAEINAAVLDAYRALLNVFKDGAIGLTGRWYGFNVQIDRA